MQPLSNLSKMKLTINRVILLILSLAGFFDSSYLTILHYKNIIPPCALARGCETVLTSQFSTILGIPIALLGSLFFITLIFILLLENQKNEFFKYFKLLTLAGVAASIFLFSIQAFILHAFCQYCLLSEIIILAIFISSFFFTRKYYG